MTIRTFVVDILSRWCCFCNAGLIFSGYPSHSFRG